MEIDPKFVRARFSGMTHEELLEEAALRADEYTPLARGILQGEALARGIDSVQIEARRKAEGSGEERALEHDIDAPALLVSADVKGQMTAMANTLCERGIPAAVRELDPKSFPCSGLQVGRWGLMVPGKRAGEAAQILASIAPQAPDDDSAGCDGCTSCGDPADPAAELWPEDGDWWKSEPGGSDPEGESGEVRDD